MTLWDGPGLGAEHASRRYLTMPWPVGIFPLDQDFLSGDGRPKSARCSTTGGLFWFYALCPLGWGPLTRDLSAVGYIVGVPLTSVERTGSGGHTPPAIPWISRPRRPTLLRGETTWQAAPDIAHAGRSTVVCRASSAFTIGDPSLGINPLVVMSAGPRPSSDVPSSRRTLVSDTLAPGFRSLVRLQWSIPG